MMRLTKLNQRGDTIVEVLIAIVVIAMAMAGAFTITNKNVRSTQDSQEHAQAAKLIESQLESLRASAASGATIPASGGFCITTTGLKIFSAANCSFDLNGTVNATATPAFQLKISRCYGGNPSCTVVDTSLYNVTATWDSIATSGQKGNESMFYKVYQP